MPISKHYPLFSRLFLNILLFPLLLGVGTFYGCGGGTGSDGINPGGNPALCGNGEMNTGEVCDGSNLNGKACTDLGYTGGQLACAADCKDFTTTACTGATAAVCGNGVVDASESCDGNNFGGVTCESLGFGPGALTCASCVLQTDQCAKNEGVCGDNTLNQGEVCDGAVLGGATCASEGLGTGTLTCASNCTQFNTSDCQPAGAGACGDSTVNAGEACDGNNLGGKTCKDAGFASGTLSCKASCQLETNACTPGGSLGWLTRVGSTGYDSISSLHLGPGQDLYISGYFYGPALEDLGFQGGPQDIPNINTNGQTKDAFIGRVSPIDGKFVWLDRLYSKLNMNTQYEEYVGLFVGASGNLYATSRLYEAKDQVLVTGSGNSMVTNTIINSTDSFIRKIDPQNGNLIWTVTLSGDDSEFLDGLVEDADGNLYFTGHDDGATGPDDILSVTSTTDATDLTMTNLTVNDGNVDVTFDTDAFVGKVSLAGDLLWLTRVASSREDQIESIQMDGTGNLYISGYFYGKELVTINFQGGQFQNIANADTNSNASPYSRDAFVAKMNPNDGTFFWVDQFSTKAVNNNTKKDDNAHLHVMPSGSVYVISEINEVEQTLKPIPTGATTTALNYGADDHFDTVLRKLNPVNGASLWTVTATASEFGTSIGDEYIDHLIEDGAENLHHTVHFNGDDLSMMSNGVIQESVNNVDSSLLANDAAFGKVFPNGQLDWLTRVGSNGKDSIHYLDLDPAGNLYVGGTFDGLKLMALPFSTGFPKDLANDDTGGPMVTPSTDVFFGKALSSNGKFVWMDKLATYNTSDFPNHNDSAGFHLDVSGDPYIVSAFTEDHQILSYTSTSSTWSTPNSLPGLVYDTAMRKINPFDGQLVWEIRAEGGYNQYTYGFVEDLVGNLYYTGYHNGVKVDMKSVSFPATNKSSDNVVPFAPPAPPQDAFFGKITP